MVLLKTTSPHFSCFVALVPAVVTLIKKCDNPLWFIITLIFMFLCILDVTSDCTSYVQSENQTKPSQAKSSKSLGWGCLYNHHVPVRSCPIPSRPVLSRAAKSIHSINHKSDWAQIFRVVQAQQIIKVDDENFNPLPWANSNFKAIEDVWIDNTLFLTLRTCKMQIFL